MTKAISLIRQFTIAAVISASIILPLMVSAQIRESTVTTDTYGDWQVVCETTRVSNKSCVMRQKYLSATTGERLLEVNLAKIEDGTLMTMILPLGIYLPAGVVLQIDEFEPVNFAISFCTEEGCFINEMLDQELLELMRKKIAAKLTVEINAGQPLHPPFSIAGFLDAYRSL